MGAENRALRATTTCIIVLAGLVPGCRDASAPRAYGSHAEILLLYDGPALADAATRLAQRLQEPVIYQGRSEPRFQVQTQAAPPSRDDLMERNIVLVTQLDSGGGLDVLTRERLSAADAARLRERGAGVFVYRDVWVREQVVAWASAVRLAALDSLLASLQPDFAARYDRAVRTRWSDALRATPHALGVPQAPARVRFDLAVPGSYRRATTPEGWPGAQSWVRDSPTRIVTLFWLDDVDSSDARNQDFLLGMQRDALWRLNKDSLVEEHFQSTASETILSGTWQNVGDVAGGPLLTRFVYDGARRRLFAVQGQLFAPGRAKHNFVRELRAIVHTFSFQEPA